MAETKSALSYDQLIAELAGLVATGRTGTMFISTAENRAARFQLQDGEIVTCFFGAKQGAEALERFRTSQGGSFRFDPTVPPATADRTLPTTDQMLADLGHSPSKTAVAARTTPGRAPRVPPAAAPRTPAPPEPPSLEEMFIETTGIFDAAAEAEQVPVPVGEFALATELITLEFACFVGPVANIWTMNYVAQFGPPSGGEGLRHLIEAMAREIQLHDRRKVRDFVQRVKQRLESVH